MSKTNSEVRAAELVRLKAEVERQARVIEKLKGMVSHYETCSTVDRYDDEVVPCDCGLDKELEALGLPTMPNGMAYQMYFTEEDIEKILTGLSCGEHEGFIDQEDADRIQDIIEKATKTK